MKKFFIYSLTVCMLALGFTSCNDDSDDHTDKRVTYYATVTLEGDDYMIVDKGSTFVDPGYSAEMQGEDATDKVVVVSDVDTSHSGVYSITYSLTNADGFSAVQERTVVVLDPNDPVEGFYYTTDEAFRNYSGTITPYGAAFEVLVIGNGDGTYSVDDLMAGWYAQRAGYGSAYAMQAVVAIDDDGNVTLEDSYVPGWDDSADDFQEGTYDADSGTLSYVLYYAGVIEFHVTMIKD